MAYLKFLGENPLYILWLYLFLVNIFAIIVMAKDKVSATMDMRRVPEKVLLGIAAIGGSVGSIFAMYFFHHKTLKLKFKFGFPAILIAQVAIVVGLCIWIK